MYPTLINVILDESGSMSPKRADVIGGFNLFLKEQQEKPEACRMILSKFNTMVTTVFQATPLADVKPLDDQAYTPGGNTALFDAVANMVRLADQAKQPDEKVVCLIITDGEENSSRETSAHLKQRRNSSRWCWSTRNSVTRSPFKSLSTSDLAGRSRRKNTCAAPMKGST